MSPAGDEGASAPLIRENPGMEASPPPCATSCVSDAMDQCCWSSAPVLRCVTLKHASRRRWICGVPASFTFDTMISGEKYDQESNRIVSRDDFVWLCSMGRRQR